MRNTFPSRRRRQRGSFLLESLIGLVLMTIISMGAVAVTSRAQVAQAQSFSRQHVINQLRLALLNDKFNGASLCPDGGLTITLPDNSTYPVDVSNCDLVTARVNGMDVPNVRLPLSLTVKIPDGDGDFFIQVGGVLGQ